MKIFCQQHPPDFFGTESLRSEFDFYIWSLCMDPGESLPDCILTSSSISYFSWISTKIVNKTWKLTFNKQLECIYNITIENCRGLNKEQIILLCKGLALLGGHFPEVFIHLAPVYLVSYKNNYGGFLSYLSEAIEPVVTALEGAPLVHIIHKESAVGSLVSVFHNAAVPLLSSSVPKLRSHSPLAISKWDHFGCEFASYSWGLLTWQFPSFITLK